MLRSAPHVLRRGRYGVEETNIALHVSYFPCFARSCSDEGPEFLVESFRAVLTVDLCQLPEALSTLLYFDGKLSPLCSTCVVT